MTEIELIGVPFDGYGRRGHQARAAAALRAAGFADAFGARPLHDRGDLDLPPGSAERGPSTLLNEPALTAVKSALGPLVRDAIEGGRFPVVYGGDCSALLAIVPALAGAHSDLGLLHVDGHEDTMPLDVSEDGEAANVEIGLLLGITGRSLTGPLAEGLPAITADRLAVLGARDADWRKPFNVASLRELGVRLRAPTELAADPAGTARAAVAHLLQTARRWWLHVDLDVLDPVVFAAQGLPGVPDEPGGLDWAQLTEVLRAAVGRGGCVGMSIVIYDPEQDPDGSEAARIVGLVRDVFAG